MSKDWKPGDVAMMTWDGNLDGPFEVVRGNGLWRMLDWVEGSKDASDKFLTDEWLAEMEPTIRPLVVIDPEDREQVERLHDLIDAAENDSMDDYALDEDSARLWAVGAVETALREFANPKPTKPEEPTGLGAVVEDADGDRWVLYTSPDSTAPWCNGSTSCEWDEVDAVRVLSEGAQP